MPGEVLQLRSVDLVALLGDTVFLDRVDEVLRQRLAHQDVLELLVALELDHRDLVLVVLLEARDLLFLDGLRPLVLVHTAAREHLDIHDGALDARRHGQRRVAHVARLLAEDGPQQLFLGRQLRLALRRDLADEDVAGLDLRADAHDA